MYALLVDSSSAQHYPEWSFAEGAKARLGVDEIYEISYSPDGAWLAAARGMHIWIYDANSGAEVSLLTGRTEDVYSVAFSTNGFILASGSGEWLGNNNAI